MSIIQPEIEYVDRATHSIRYLEHGWPTDLCRWHSHEEYELHLIVATRGQAFVGDYIGDFSPGSLYLTGPRLPHNWITDSKTPKVAVRDMLVQFSHDSIERLSDAFHEFGSLSSMFELSKSGIEFVGFDSSIARSFLESIRDGSDADRIVSLLDFLVCLNVHPEKRPLSVLNYQHEWTSKHIRIGMVIDHIADNYSEPISVERAADLAGMSPTAFSRHFRVATGSKFVDFVNRVRIAQACSLLYGTDDQISSICFHVGFQNLANFNRNFLKMKKLTPTAYRAVARERLTSGVSPQ